MADSDDRDLYSGLIRLHVLHHAVEQPIFGLGMIEELGRHGYKVSPGSLYPLLQGLEKKGYLKRVPRYLGKKQQTSNAFSLDGLVAKLKTIEPEFTKAAEQARLKRKKLEAASA